jgi:DNA-binding transcriptional LysR family regulator
MDKATAPLDWALLPAILAVADTGSLSAAARQTGLSQPTLGRQVRAAEEALGGRLFDRHARGLSPTDLLLGLLPQVRIMRDAAEALALQAEGQAKAETGTVRLTASHVVSCFLLPPILTQFRRAHPGLAVELAASDTTQNLLFHEADIALRMYRPTQLDMITRHLGDLPIGLYATPDYIARHGRPETLHDLLDHDLIGYDRSDLLLQGFRDAGLPMTRDSFVLRCDDQVTYWRLVLAGAGIGVGQRAVAAQTPDLVQLFPDADLPRLPVWITAHERLRHTPRVDALWRALTDGLAPLLT